MQMRREKKIRKRAIHMENSKAKEEESISSEEDDQECRPRRRRILEAR